MGVDDHIFVVICEGRRHVLRCGASDHQSLQQEIAAATGVPLSMQKMINAKTGATLCHGRLKEGLAAAVDTEGGKTMLVVQRLLWPNGACSCFRGKSGGSAAVAAASVNTQPRARTQQQQQQQRQLRQQQQRQLTPEQAQQRQQAMACTAMRNRLAANIAGIRNMERPQWQAFARNVIPAAELRMRAQSRLSEQEGVMPPLDFNDCLLLELMAWFKNDFYEWVDKLPCAACGETNTNFHGMCQPSQQDLKFGARRVEGYRCPKVGCNRITRFPRYNHAQRLLEVGCRRGRCGEWAQAFTLCVRAMGLEARMAHDWTDHVWTEVYSESARRWVHCDPCENQRDRPLTYEVGWKKKLSYIISFHRNHVLDTTKRYTRDFPGCLTRRKQVSEQWLAKELSTINDRLSQTHTPQGSVRRLALQAVLDKEKEQIEARYRLGLQQLREDEKQGRVSGGIAWRLRRGETKASGGGDPLDWEVPSALKADGVGALEDALCETKGVGRRHSDTRALYPLKDLSDKSGVDKSLVGTVFRLAELRVWAGNYVHGIQHVWEAVGGGGEGERGRLIEGEARGDCPSGSSEITCTRVVLRRGEHIVCVGGRSGDIIDHLKISTSQGRTFEFGFSEGGTPWCLMGPNEGFPVLVALFAGAGGHVHNLLAIYRRRSPPSSTSSSTSSSSSSSSASQDKVK
jgi:hypothetical protein